ncbi:hypothetical protein [Kamptonema formosum]|nr:hypothetical protein [Kamptonema formosum]
MTSVRGRIMFAAVILIFELKKANGLKIGWFFTQIVANLSLYSSG